MTESGWLLEARVANNGDEINGDTLVPGCFARSLAQRYPPLAFFHDTRLGIGTTVDHRDHAEGLDMTFRVLDITPGAQHAVDAIESGRLQEFSVGFRRFQEEPVEYAVLDEVSLVYKGACPNTRVLSLTPFVESTSESRTPAEIEADEVLAEHDLRFGSRRQYDPAEFWVAQSARRAAVANG